MRRKFFTISVTVKHKGGRTSKYEPSFYWPSMRRTLSSVLYSLATRLQDHRQLNQKYGPPVHAVIRIRDANDKITWEHLIKFPSLED